MFCAVIIIISAAFLKLLYVSRVLGDAVVRCYIFTLHFVSFLFKIFLITYPKQTVTQSN